MKKIILALMMISSFAFSLGDYTQISSGYTLFNHNYLKQSGGSCWSTDTGVSWGATQTTVVLSSNINSIVSSGGNATSRLWTISVGSAGSTGLNYKYTGSIVNNNFCVSCASPNILDASGNCINPVPTCTANQYLQNNVCINQPTCELGTTLNPTTHTCTIDFPITSTDYLEGGGVILHYEDNKIMLLRRDGTAESWDLETGQYFFPNRAFEGVIPPSASYNPLSFNPSEPIQYKELTVGDFVAFEFNQMGIALKDASKFLTAPALLWTFGLSTKKETPDNIVLTQSSSISGTSISASTSNTPNIDFSEYENTATSTPQTIPNTDIQVQKITTPPNPNDANNWAGAGSTIKGWAGVGELGSVIVSTPYNPNTVLITTPTQVKIATIKSDNSVDVVTIQKADLVSTATNNTNLNFQTSTVTPTKINNDGTTSQTTIPTGQGSVSTTNGTTSNTSATTGATTTTTNPTSGTPTIAPTTSPSGAGTIDLSGVTSRLDKISNQLTLENQFFEKLDKATASETANPIDHVKGQGLIDTFSTSWGNIKSDFDRITVMTDEAQNTIKQGFTFSLAHGSVNECAYTLDFDYGVGTSVINVDFCKSFSPLRPTLYVLFNLFFQSILLLFAFKSITRLV